MRHKNPKKALPPTVFLKRSRERVEHTYCMSYLLFNVQWAVVCRVHPCLLHSYLITPPSVQVLRTWSIFLISTTKFQRWSLPEGCSTWQAYNTGEELFFSYPLHLTDSPVENPRHNRSLCTWSREWQGMKRHGRMKGGPVPNQSGQGSSA